MVKRAQQVLAHALAPSTRKSYNSAVAHVAKFHERLNFPFTLPVSSDTLCIWMADSVDKLRFTSIRNYLHGVATLQQELGFANPLQSVLVWRMYKSIKRLQGQHVVRQRLPITISILIRIRPFFDKTNLRHLCMRAAMWLGTCGLLRSGEFTTKSTTTNVLQLKHLTFFNSRHLEVDLAAAIIKQPAYMSLHLEQSKTDPFRKGADIIISNPRAVRYMLDYLCNRKPLKRMPLFVDPNTGQALSVAALVKFTQSMITRAQIPNPESFLGHSFRKGGATSLHEAGHPDSLIKMMGRWQSFAFASYVHPPRHKMIAAGHSLSKVEVYAEDAAPTTSSFWDVNNLQ